MHLGQTRISATSWELAIWEQNKMTDTRMDLFIAGGLQPDNMMRPKKGKT